MVESGFGDVDSLEGKMKLAERQISPPVGFHIAARLKILGQEVGLPLGPLIFMLRWNEPIHGLRKKQPLFRGLNDMATYKMHLPGRPDAVLGSVPEQDLNKIIIAMFYLYSALLNRVARSITHNTTEAEDVVQETFPRVLRHENKLAELQNVRT
jgi:hypothetical protein